MTDEHPVSKAAREKRRQAWKTAGELLDNALALPELKHLAAQYIATDTTRLAQKAYAETGLYLSHPNTWDLTETTGSWYLLITPDGPKLAWYDESKAQWVPQQDGPHIEPSAVLAGVSLEGVPTKAQLASLITANNTGHDDDLG